MTDVSRPVPDYPSAARARRGVAVLALLGFFLSMDATLTTLLIEPMKRDLTLSEVQIGLLQGTAYGLSFGLASLPMGRLIDARDRVRLMVLGLGVWMAAMTATGLASGVTVLMVARVALGAAAALLIPASLSLIADLYPADRRSGATSLFIVGQAAGQALGILAGGLAFDALTYGVAGHVIDLAGLAPWRALYLATTVIGLLPLALLALMREPARQERGAQAEDTLPALRELWRYRRFLVPLLAAMLFIQVTMQATSVWAAPVLMRTFHLTPGQFAGWLSAVMLGGGILGALAGGLLGNAEVRRGGRARVLLPALLAALAIIPLSCFALVPSLPAFAVILGFNIFAGAIIQTIGAIAVTLNVPNEVRGLALGANLFFVTVFGTATAPAVIALLSGALGGEAHLGMAIAVVSGPSGLIAAGCFALAMRARLDDRSPGQAANADDAGPAMPPPPIRVARARRRS